MNKKIPIEFSLARIETNQFAILADYYNKDSDAELKTAFQQGINKNNKAIAIKAQFAFEQNKAAFLVVEATCWFNIAEESWKACINNESLIIPKVFLAHLAMITVGTIRGILHAKTENTLFNDFIIPTINVTKIFNEDLNYKVTE